MNFLRAVPPNVIVVRNPTDRVYRADRDTFAEPRQFVCSVGFEF